MGYVNPEVSVAKELKERPDCTGCEAFGTGCLALGRISVWCDGFYSDGTVTINFAGGEVNVAKSRKILGDPNIVKCAGL